MLLCTGPHTALLGLILYLLLNWSYTTAVWVSPGSPLADQAAYSSLPSAEAAANTSIMVKSTGDLRYCKKCQARKPDRAHHCSSCGRCVLKMDHHCPWLAACVGFRNYKPFLLFLIYTSVFCWLSFAVSATWVYKVVLNDETFSERLMPVNYILLAVLGGIIGLVLSGFTGWHIYLAINGQTTIESLEKTRYLTPMRKSMQQQLQQRDYIDNQDAPLTDQIREIHANALPGVTRPEEGEERSSPARDSLRRNWQDQELMREQDRYDDYLDEQDSEKLPNAFDLGWRRNLRHVFGERPLLWWLPVCNTTGDGWSWEASQAWVEAHQELAREREARARENEMFSQDRGWHKGPIVDFRNSTSTNGGRLSCVSPSSVENNRFMTPPPRRGTGTPRGGTPRSGTPRIEGSPRRHLIAPTPVKHISTSNWNDIPDDMFTGKRAVSQVDPNEGAVCKTNNLAVPR